MTTRTLAAGMGGPLAFVVLTMCVACTSTADSITPASDGNSDDQTTEGSGGSGGVRKGSGGAGGASDTTRSSAGGGSNTSASTKGAGGSGKGGAAAGTGTGSGGKTVTGAGGKGTGGKSNAATGATGGTDKGTTAGGGSKAPTSTDTSTDPVGTTNPLLGDVAFSTPSQSFKNQIEVGLSTTVSGAEIRYTVDGKVPTASSTAYSGTPLTLKETTQVRAQAFVNGTASGAASTGIYIARTVDLTSDIPIIFVDGYGSGKPCDKEVSLDAAVMIWEPVNGEASLSSLPTVAARVGYHARGQSSITFPQLSYKIEFRDNADKDLDYPILGMPADSDWALIAPYYDRTLIRNPFTYTLGKDMGMAVARTAFAEVYVNYTKDPIGDAAYQGIYWVSETIKNNKVRQNLKQLKETDTDAAKLSGAYIMKFDQMAAEEPKLTCTGSNPLPGMSMGAFGGGAMGGGAVGGGAVGGGAFGGGATTTPPTSGCTMKMGSFGTGTGQAGTCWTDLEVVDPVPLNADQKTWITTYIQQFHDSLHKTPIGDYAQYIDLPTFIDYMIISEMTLNVDAYTKSAYYFKDRDEKLKAGPLWDYNFALGGVGAMNATPQSTSDTGWRYSGNRNINNWYPKLATDPNFMAQVKTRYTELRKTLLSQSAIDERINTLSAPLKKAITHDYTKWPVSSVIPSTTGFYGGPTAPTWDGQIKAMRDFLTARLAWMDTNLK